jgi:hypothetical protein
MLERNENNKYSHYKGNTYYKLAEPFFVIKQNPDKIRLDIVQMIPFTFESTLESGRVYVTSTGIAFMMFEERQSTIEEQQTNFVLYQSKDTCLYWVRSKDEFDGYVFNDINDESIKRFTKI